MRYRSINPIIWFPVASLLLFAIAFWPKSERSSEKPNKFFDHKDIKHNKAPKVLCVVGVQVRVGECSNVKLIMTASERFLSDLEQTVKFGAQQTAKFGIVCRQGSPRQVLRLSTTMPLDVRH